MLIVQVLVIWLHLGVTCMNLHILLNHITVF